MPGTPRQSAPTPEEAAAIVAAVERFLRDHASGAAAEPEGPDPWRRAALLEGVRRDPTPPDANPWINT